MTQYCWINQDNIGTPLGKCFFLPCRWIQRTGISRFIEIFGTANQCTFICLRKTRPHFLELLHSIFEDVTRKQSVSIKLYTLSKMLYSINQVSSVADKRTSVIILIGFVHITSFGRVDKNITGLVRIDKNISYFFFSVKGVSTSINLLFSIFS